MNNVQQKNGTAVPFDPDDTTLGDKLGSPFLDGLGMRLVYGNDDIAQVHLTLSERHTNRWAVAHGGVIMTLLDAALAVAARQCAGGTRAAKARSGVTDTDTFPGTADLPGVVTVEMKVSFFQPGRGALQATGRILHRSTTMAFCEGEVRDAAGELLAKGLGTFKYLRRLPVGRELLPQRESGA